MDVDGCWDSNERTLGTDYIILSSYLCIRRGREENSVKTHSLWINVRSSSSLSWCSAGPYGCCRLPRMIYDGT